MPPVAAHIIAKGELVDMTDEEAAESLAWDIAFDRNYIRTNSGEGCKGNGGALDMNKTEFDDCLLYTSRCV